MNAVHFPDGTAVPVLGQGTWNMGEDAARRADELAALRLGLDLGLRLIDTAEMYADGGAESLVREVIAGRRDEAFLVSKAYPQNASAIRLPRACEASLRRLGTDRLDLYLLHRRESVPLAETIKAMEGAGRRRQGAGLGCEQPRHHRHGRAGGCRWSGLRH